MTQANPTRYPCSASTNSIRIGIGLVAIAVVSAGCTSLWRGDSDDPDGDAAFRELARMPELPELVRTATVSQGIHPIRVDGVGAVNALQGTGGAPDPSSFREQLLEEMKRHDVADANGFLENSDTALVRVRATIPPGARRGDPIDVQVLAPKQSRTNDLHGGWLMNTRLRQQQVLDNAVRQSEVIAVGTGALLTRSDYTPGPDASLRLEANILGGGRVQEARKLGLIVRPDFRHAKMSAAIAEAISRRFFFFDGSTRRGVAKAIEDDFIEVDIHPRYRENVARFMEVVRAIGCRRRSSDSQARLADLAQKLTDPATASDAAIQLEAIGENAVPTLLRGIESTNPELRFYAAEALAYLDQVESVEPLEQLIRDEAAFRHPALLALQRLQNPRVNDALQRLLDAPSLETRYGAFRCLRRRSDGKRLLDGRSLDAFTLYQVPSTAPSTIVVSLRDVPEVVLLGEMAPVEIAKFIRGPSGIMITNDREQWGMMKVSRFQVDEDDRRVAVPNSLPAVIQAIVAVGGGYGDVVAMLRNLKDVGGTADQLAMDPLPRSMRTYFRDTDSSAEQMAEEDSDSIRF